MDRKRGVCSGQGKRDHGGAAKLSALGGEFVWAIVCWGPRRCPLYKVRRHPLLGGFKCISIMGTISFWILNVGWDGQGRKNKERHVCTIITLDSLLNSKLHPRTRLLMIAILLPKTVIDPMTLRILWWCTILCEKISRHIFTDRTSFTCKFFDRSFTPTRNVNEFSGYNSTTPNGFTDNSECSLSYYIHKLYAIYLQEHIAK